MTKDRSHLEEAIEKGERENGSVEFKSSLEKDIHLEDNKRKSLVAQMRYRIMSGDGCATYVIGVSDDGEILGLEPNKFSESMDVLSLLARETDAYIQSVDTWEAPDGKLVGLASVKEGTPENHDNAEDHIIIGTGGHVDHGKSTLVGTLMTGDKDDGEGSIREYLDVKPHEIERGLSADISYALYGFDSGGNPLRLDNPNRSSDRSNLVEDSEKLVSFVDTVGHQPWLKTTIRGLIGQKIDCGLLAVAADDGPTKITREHLGLMIAIDMPVIVAITKTDMVSEERVDEVEMEIEKLLRQVDRSPILVRRHGVDYAVNEVDEKSVPIIRTSAVTMQGIEELDRLIYNIEPSVTDEQDPHMYIDKIYNVDGIGPVVSGTIQSGVIETGDNLKIGPFKDGGFREVTARSIEIHYYSVDKAKAGQIASVAISDVQVDELSRGMVLLPTSVDPKPVKKFKAEVVVLNHPTKITDGYEPVLHLETISDTVVIHPDNKQMMAGDKEQATIEFKFGSHYIEEGQKFVFREGKSKGVGHVKEIID